MENKTIKRKVQGTQNQVPGLEKRRCTWGGRSEHRMGPGSTVQLQPSSEHCSLNGGLCLRSWKGHSFAVLCRPESITALDYRGKEGKTQLAWLGEKTGMAHTFQEIENLQKNHSADGPAHLRKALLSYQ